MLPLAVCAALCLVAVLSHAADDDAACRQEGDLPIKSSAMLQVQHAKMAATLVAQAVSNKTADPDFHFGSLHDVVGQDGVLVISLERKQARFDYSSGKLKEAGILATEFPAADVERMSPEELNQGCAKGEANAPEANAQTCHGRAGGGCTYVNEQAVAESHRRALTAAMERKNDWTAILEDDVVPVRPEIWNAAFEKAWREVPEHVKLVRLGWCQFPDEENNKELTLSQETFRDVGDFQVLNWVGYMPGHNYNPGLCTTAYMVHRDIIPEMLKLFPCCCALDCCFLYDFLGKGWEEGSPRGQQILMHLDAQGSTDYARGLHLPWVHQSGIFVQDAKNTPSTQAWMNTIKSVTDRKSVV